MTIFLKLFEVILAVFCACRLSSAPTGLSSAPSTFFFCAHRCRYYLIRSFNTASDGLITDQLLPFACHALATFLPRHCHALATFLPRSCHAPATFLPRYCSVLVTLLLRSCLPLAMLLPRSCHKLLVKSNELDHSNSEHEASNSS